MIKYPPFKMKRWIRLIAANILVLVLLLVVIEGLASYSLLTYDIMTSLPSAERRHTQYDPDLGWVHIPNVHIPDMYGSGIYLRTNSQGFRNNRDFDAMVPNGKNRVICAGNSFTLGYGVDNDHTWCERLTSLDPRLETVNMGQGGYGLDQVYLWFKRDIGKLKHHVHLLAFITHDFFRMQSDRFAGYGKPVIQIADGRLVVRNVPVPRPAYGFSWLLSRRAHVKKLRTTEFLSRALLRDRVSPSNTTDRPSKDKNEETRNVLAKIFEELKYLNEEHSSKLVLVYLPHLSDLRGNGPEKWIKFVERVSRTLDIPLINVLSGFRSLPYEDAVKLFIAKGKMKYPGADSHLNDQGNEVVARMIYAELKNHLSPPQ